MTNQKSLLLIFRTAPFMSSANRDNLDIALACAAFDIPVSLLFLNDGVLQLLPNQQSQLVDQKDLSKTLNALPMYDIDQCFVLDTHLAKHQLTSTELTLDCTVLPQQELATFIQSFDVAINL